MVSKIVILNVKIPGNGVKTTVFREDRVARPRLPRLAHGQAPHVLLGREWCRELSLVGKGRILFLANLFRKNAVG